MNLFSLTSLPHTRLLWLRRLGGFPVLLLVMALAILAGAPPLHAQLQERLTVTRDTSLEAKGTHRIRTTGESGRVYLLQVTTNLKSWTYAQTSKLGSGAAIDYWFTPVSGQRYYFRLRYTTTPVTTPSDIDNDGATNDSEITAGTDPFNPDTDGDGIWDSKEAALSLNPLSRNTLSTTVEDPWRKLDPATAQENLIISEYQAVNRSTIADDNNDYSDWLEILNPTTAAVSLNGWKLSDKPDSEPGKWVFPDGISLDPGKTLLVWASDKNKRVAGKSLHTNFKLDATYDAVALINPAGTIVDRHDWNTAQVEDTSAGWGIDNESGSADGKVRKLRVFSQPTPGALNTEAAYLGVCGTPAFSVNGGVFSGAAVSVSVAPNDPAQTLRYTTDCTLPTPSSPVLNAPLSISTTTILRVTAFQAGKRPSPVITRSFLFKEKVLGTASQGTLPTDHQVKPADWPDATTEAAYPIDYAMSPAVIKENKNALLTQLSAIPTVSIVLKKEDFFSKKDGGIYANSAITESPNDPQNSNWERLASIEFHNPATGITDQENGLLSITGASSIYPTTTPKHSLRIDFRKKVTTNPEGVMNFQQEPLGGSTLKKYRTLMLRNPTHDSWCLVWGGWMRDESTYVKEAWARATHQAMGHNIAHRKWCHLYINGLYWGVYELGERINEDYMRAYGAAKGSYDVIRQGGEVQDGDRLAYEDLLAKAREAAAAPADALKWGAVTDRLDVDQYIDYLMVGIFANNEDWAGNGNNWRAARQRDLPTGYAEGKFRFFVWDAEYAMHSTALNNNYTGATVGALELHGILLAHPDYKARWKSRVTTHFDTPGGVFAVNGATNEAAMRFGSESTLFDTASLCENARWGDGGGATITRASWVTNTDYLKNTWIKDRRAIVRSQLQARGLAKP